MNDTRPSETDSTVADAGTGRRSARIAPPTLGHPGADDSNQWRRVVANDSDAFADVYDRYANEIYTFCFRRTANWATAEDLTSIVFLEAWRLRSRLKDPAKLRSWLYGIALNTLRSQWRATRRHRHALARLPLEASVTDFGPESDARMDDERAMRQILDELHSLPRRDLEVLSLCVWADMSYEDAAETLSIPVGTVRSRLSRAKARLAQRATVRRVADHA